jgi:hypothetical protein
MRQPESARCPVYSNGQYCGRRVAVLYAAGDLFACRHCYGLAYASQQESPRSRAINRSRKIRMRLGGGPDLLQPFPKKPRGMHQQTYMRIRERDLLLLKAALGRQNRFGWRTGLIYRLKANYLVSAKVWRPLGNGIYRESIGNFAFLLNVRRALKAASFDTESLIRAI